MIDPQALLPDDADMAAMRAAVAAYITGDFHGIEVALADAQHRGRSMQFIAAAWAQLAHAYNLVESDEALADWRQGILFHLAAEEDKSDE
jgi:hypothetical protein